MNTTSRLTNVFLENIYLGVSVIGSLFFVLVLLLPSLSAIPSLRTQLTEKSTELAQLKLKSARLSSLLDNRETLRSSLKLADFAIPSKDSVPTLMTQVQTITSDSGVLLKALQFGSTSIGSAGASGRIVTDKSVKKVYLQAVAEGQFANLQTFLRNLESASRIVTVDTLTFEASREGTGSLTSTLGLVSYYVDSLPVDPSLSLDLESTQLKGVLEQLKSLKVYEPEVSFSGVGKANPFE